ncbi:hypothetical protein PRO82_001364 [Candidatus Protochlamydia amoebophila]|nr:hypothetical protein [Candidatus Protochlamydia amoebophila]
MGLLKRFMKFLELKTHSLTLSQILKNILLVEGFFKHAHTGIFIVFDPNNLEYKNNVNQAIKDVRKIFSS